MLLAVEGGGFFSSSASGYSKGLALLILGQKHDDKPMRVTPWNQYQLVDREPDPDLQLASLKKRLSRGCASFVCFGCASTEIDSSSQHLKVGPTTQDADSLNDDKAGDRTGRAEHESRGKKVSLKSSLKKPLNRNPAAPIPAEDDNQSSDNSHGSSCDTAANVDRRRVQWTDVCGHELVQIREFEPSETCGSDEDIDGGSERSCACVIM